MLCLLNDLEATEGMVRDMREDSRAYRRGRQEGYDAGYADGWAQGIAEPLNPNAFPPLFGSTGLVGDP